MNPDDYRMSVGEHLEELRTRLFLSLAGYAVVLVACFLRGDRVIALFCDPLITVLERNNINPQLVFDEVGEGFTVFIKISMVTAAAIASPWIVYQIWQFIAAGMYPHERKYVTRYLPLSIGLLITGMAFVYLMVLPWTLDFLITFGSNISPWSRKDATVPALVQQAGQANVPGYKGNPQSAAEGDMWIDRDRNQLKIMVGGNVRVLAIRSEQLLAAEIKLSTYIDLVVSMLLIFGISFQLPLAVLALERVGIVQIDALRAGRRHVYFGMGIAAAVITPGGDIPTMLLLTVPLIGLYELGIWLARFGGRIGPNDADKPKGPRPGRYANLRVAASTPAFLWKILRGAGIVLFVALLAHALYRAFTDGPAIRDNPVPTQPAPATAPATLPTTVPTTAPITAWPAPPSTAPTTGPVPMPGR